MAQEILPADAIGIGLTHGAVEFAPVAAIVGADIGVGIKMPNGWRFCLALHPAAMKAGDRRAAGAINLQRHQIVAAHTRRPGADDCPYRSVVEFCKRDRTIVDVDSEMLALFVHAIADRGRCRGHHATQAADYVLDDVTPVRIHIERQTAAAAAMIIPARALAWRVDAIEYPIAEIQLEAGNTVE